MELDSLRCQEPCPTQNGVAAPTDPAAAQPCVCGLISRISDPSSEWVPKDEFVAVLQKFHYPEDKALKKYSTYALDKIETKHSDEFKRLRQEAKNAYNWAGEGEYEASLALAEVHAETEELKRLCKAELAKIMAE